MTADATERLAVIATDPGASASLVQALKAATAANAANADQHGLPDDLLDAAPLAQAVLAGHLPAWPADVFLVLIGAADGRADPATATLRTALFAAGVDHAVVSGPLDQQLAATRSTWQTRQSARRLDRAGLAARGPKWRHACGRCGDGDCEARLFEAVRRARPTA
ncbi:hypothetical protein ACWA7J_14620 [Leptothrix sp. BB-4]